MEPAIDDLVRKLGEEQRPTTPELGEVEVNVELGEDDLLLDPWFWRTEEEIASIEDDPSAQIVEIRVADYGTGFCDRRWAF
jgi:hypothetical protein